MGVKHLSNNPSSEHKMSIFKALQTMDNTTADCCI